MLKNTRQFREKMRKFSEIVDAVIKGADIILIVLDARNIEDSLNKNIEEKIRKFNKKFLYVINKCDLLGEEETRKINVKNSVKISASKHKGTMILLRKIMEVSRGKNAVVGVVGMPNTGKSTIINALKGKHSAPTSSMSGYTKGFQKVRVNNKIMLIDTPGVFPYNPEKNINFVMLGFISPEKIEDLEDTAIKLIETMDGKAELFFGVEKNKDALKTLEKIAMKKGFLKKGGIPDTQRASRLILNLCQEGKI